MPVTGQTTASSPTVDPREVARFGALAAQWWDPAGKMGMLHKFNPVRLGYIKEAACRQFARDPKRLDSLSGLRILDIGCGAGILSEPLARLGAQVTGADPAVPNIEAAKVHAAGQGLTLDYRATTAEALASASTWCSPWRWWSMWRTSACSCSAAPRW
jgi:2-polyprenyl-6-hydroxyphenyl methylase / 3-demethylubiquinone-9 3-methyltransferase